jgi:hypothetical protein
MKLGIKTTGGVSKLKTKTTDGVAKAVECACCVSIPFSLFLENKSGSGAAELGYNRLYQGYRDKSTYFATATRTDSGNAISSTWPEVIESPYPNLVYSTHGSLSGSANAYQPWYNYPGGTFTNTSLSSGSLSIVLSDPVTPGILESRAISARNSSVKQWASPRAMFDMFGMPYEFFASDLGTGYASLSTLGVNCRVQETASRPDGVTHWGNASVSVSGAESYRLSFTSPPTNYLRVWIRKSTIEQGQQPGTGACYTGALQPISESFSETSILLANPANYKKKSSVQYSDEYSLGSIGSVYNGAYSAYQKDISVQIIKYSFVQGYEPDISDPYNKQPNGFPNPNWEASPP